MVEALTRYQRRVRAATAAVTAVVVLGTLLMDWTPVSGEHHVFSQVKPTVRRTLNRAFGRESKEERASHERERKNAAGEAIGARTAKAHT